MRVCIVTTAFPRWAGDDRGAFILEAARALHREGLFVRVIAMHSPSARTRETMDGVEVIRPRYLWPESLEMLQKEGGGLPEMWRKRRLARWAILPFCVAHTLAVMRYARDCDIIHANWTLSAVAAWAGRVWHRRPMLAMVHGSDIYQAAQIRPVRFFTRLALARCARVLAPSRSLADATIALGIPPNRVEVIPNGVDTDRFRPGLDEREPIILFVGSLIPRKGVSFLIRSMVQVSRTLPEFRLVIAGEGSLRSDLVALAESLGLADRICFVGLQPPNAISEWMRRARLFVLPSIEEGLGVVILEALASGTPCVGSHVGGIPDAISPDVGMLVPPADEYALSQAIIRLLADEEAWRTMSRHARARALEHYAWAHSAKRLTEIYQEILNGDA